MEWLKESPKLSVALLWLSSFGIPSHNISEARPKFSQFWGTLTCSYPCHPETSGQRELASFKTALWLEHLERELSSALLWELILIRKMQNNFIWKMWIFTVQNTLGKWKGWCVLPTYLNSHLLTCFYVGFSTILCYTKF